MMNGHSLRGKTVLISGALGGIGLSLIRAFAEAKAVVVGFDIRSPSSSESASLKAIGGEVSLHRVDVSDYDQVEKAFLLEEKKLAELYGLVNNVGVAGPRGPIDSLDTAGLPRLFATNVYSAFYTCQLAAPIMKSRGIGRIINIASIAGQLGYQNRSAYSASKWAMVGFTKSLAIELGAFGVAVNAVAPGAVSGAAIEAAIERNAAEKGISKTAALEALTSQTSMGKLVTPESIADLVVFLCSSAGDFITGQTIGVDAGTTHLI